MNRPTQLILGSAFISASLLIGQRMKHLPEPAPWPAVQFSSPVDREWQVSQRNQVARMSVPSPRLTSQSVAESARLPQPKTNSIVLPPLEQRHYSAICDTVTDFGFVFITRTNSALSGVPDHWAVRDVVRDPVHFLFAIAPTNGALLFYCIEWTNYLFKNFPDGSPAHGTMTMR